MMHNKNEWNSGEMITLMAWWFFIAHKQITVSDALKIKSDIFGFLSVFWFTLNPWFRNRRFSYLQKSKSN